MTINKHIEETKLELYILNSPALVDERAKIEAHLAECKGCKELYDNVAEFYTSLKADLETSENLPAVIPNKLPARTQHDIQKRLSDYIMRPEVNLALPFRVARWAIRHPYVSSGGSLMFSALIIAGLINLFKPAETKPRDLNPTHAEFKGEIMLVKNKYGEVIDEEWIGERTVYHNRNFQENKLLAFEDIDGDQFNEVIWAQSIKEASDYDKNNIVLLKCKSIKLNKIFWERAFTQSLTFTNQTDYKGDRFRISGILSGDYDLDGSKEIYILTCHTNMFPSILYKLNGIDGTEVSHYLTRYHRSGY
ncbi:MAG: hypothetical protein HY800_07625 [Ignavibacteriales bacterium]|nr:hypothetical protein [Ignavibacteriales bacterium]